MFNFAAAAVGDIGFAPDAAGKPAAGNRSHQKREQRDPVLRVGDGERSDRRQKKIVERQHRGDRHEHRDRHSPNRGNC